MAIVNNRDQRVRPALIWQKEASDWRVKVLVKEQNVSVIYTDVRWNIMMSYLRYLLVGPISFLCASA